MMRLISNPADLRLIAILSAVLLALTMGCASTNEPTEGATDTGTDSEFSDGMGGAAADDMQSAAPRMTAADVDLPPVYFDLDSSEIRSEYHSALQGGAIALQESGATVVIEGHCDERGSEEYNFALGERRAGAVRKFLFNLGVPSNQMAIVSKGEAQPAVSGRGESAWRMNRRAEFRVR